MGAKETLQAVINTLNTVSVSGAENMSRMLGCIQHLTRLQSALAKGEKTDEEHSED